MALRIEDYAMIGDTHTAALVGHRRLDRLAVPAALRLRRRLRRPARRRRQRPLADRPDDGHDPSRPRVATAATRSCWRPNSRPTPEWLRVVDAMVPEADEHCVLRLVEGISGTVRMRSDAAHAVRLRLGRARGCAGSTAASRPSPGRTRSRCAPTSTMTGRDMATVADFEIRNGESLAFQLRLAPLAPRPAADASMSAPTIDRVEAWWANWMAGFNYDGRWQDAVRRSVITLKGLTYASTGGIVAAATTSLPEQLGGVRNWDYRFCWLRDATITLIALIDAGFVAGGQGLARMAAARDRRGPVEAADHVRRRRGAPAARVGGALAAGLPGRRPGAGRQCRGRAVPARRLRRGDGRAARRPRDRAQATAGRRATPPRGGAPRHLLVAAAQADGLPGDRLGAAGRRHLGGARAAPAFRALEGDGLGGGRPRDRAASPTTGCTARSTKWRALRDKIRADILANGFDADRNTFTQYYGSTELDAALLNIPLVGFLPGNDPRVQGTVSGDREGADVRRLRAALHDHRGRRRAAAGRGRVPGVHLLAGRQLRRWSAGSTRRSTLFERLLDLRNDVGLLAEEWDPVAQRMTGNFPQAFSHVPLVYTARNISHALEAGLAQGPLRDRVPRRPCPAATPAAATTWASARTWRRLRTMRRRLAPREIDGVLRRRTGAPGDRSGTGRSGGRRRRPRSAGRRPA